VNQIGTDASMPVILWLDGLRSLDEARTNSDRASLASSLVDIAHVVSILCDPATVNLL